MYLIAIPGNRISPKPSIEHFIKGELYDIIKGGIINFIGKSIDVATYAITDVPKNTGLMKTQNIS